MQVSVGTPPQRFTAIADTGSDLVWVQSDPCSSCSGSVFHPQSSSTFRTISCQSQLCGALPDSSCGRTARCEYLYEYGRAASSLAHHDNHERPERSLPHLRSGLREQRLRWLRGARWTGPGPNLAHVAARQRHRIQILVLPCGHQQQHREQPALLWRSCGAQGRQWQHPVDANRRQRRIPNVLPGNGQWCHRRWKSTEQPEGNHRSLGECRSGGEFGGVRAD